MDYFRILADNTGHADRWFLGEPFAATGAEIDARKFCYSRPYSGPAPWAVPIGQDGRRVAFNFGAFDMPVVSSEIAERIEHLAPHDVQRFRVLINGDIQGYEILNVVSQERCVDEVRSNVRKWGPEDGRPDKIGQYLEFNPLVIDPRRMNGCHLLRIWGSLVELIVSEDVRNLLSSFADIGIVFKQVS